MQTDVWKKTSASKFMFSAPLEPNSCWEPKALAAWKFQLCVCVRVYPHGRGSLSTIHTQPQADHLFRRCRNIHLQYLTKLVDKFPNIAHISGYLSSPFPSFRQQLGVQRSSKLRGVPPLEPKRIAQDKKHKASICILSKPNPIGSMYIWYIFTYI